MISSIYSNHYEKNWNSGLQGFGSSLFHKAIENDWINHEPKRILEIGAGSGEHLKFLKLPINFSGQYYALDLVKPEKVVSNDESVTKIPITWIIGDAENLPFPDNFFDRIIMTCVLHHLQEPWLALNEMK